MLATIAAGPTGSAQEYSWNVQSYGIVEGLSHRNVQCIYQDRRGFIWLGTDNGLNRFDGYHFKWFFKEKNGLSSSEVNHILEDKNGLLWLFDTGYFVDQKVNALTIFDPDTYTFQSLEEKFGNNLPFNAKDILAFARNDKGHLVFITQNWQLAIYTGVWELHNIHLEGAAKASRILWATDDTFWIMLEDVGRTLYVVDRKGGAPRRMPAMTGKAAWNFKLSIGTLNEQLLHYLRNNQSPASFAPVDIDRIRQETGHALPLSTTDYDALYSQRLAETLTHFWVIFEGRQLIVVNKSSRRLVALHEQYTAFKNANCVFVDKNQTVWAGTIFGLYHIQFKKSVFQVYLQNEGPEGTNDVVVCRQITGNQSDRIWVRVENPNDIWEINLKDHSAFNIGRGNGSLPPLPFALSENNKAVLFTSDHTLLYPDKGDLIRADLPTRRFRRIPTRRTDRIVWTLQEDRQGKVWFCDKNTNEIGYLNGDSLTILPNKPVETGFLYVYQFLQIPHSDSAWLATNQGLLLLNTQTGAKVRHFQSSGQGEDYSPFDNIHHLYPDPDGSFWAATAGSGIVHYTAGTAGLKIIRQYTRIDGLSNNAVYAIYGDDYDNLWLATDYGINQFNKKTGRFRNYTVNDGLPSNEFNRASHFQDRSGRIYFGSMNGVTAFHPRDIIGDTLQGSPPLVISSFEQFDGRTNQLTNKMGELLQTNSIVVRPDDPYFLLEFALLTFYETDKTQFAYLIEGVDKQWNYQRENFLRLSRLPYGSHTLRIKGQNAAGEWSARQLSIRLLVLKPFYLQTWFLLSVGITLLTAAFGFYKWRVGSLQAQRDYLERVVAERTHRISEDKKIIEQQKEELQSLEQLKSRFFANVSHELRTPLTLLLGPVRSLLKRSEHTEGETAQLLQFIERNARHLQKLINEILDLSKLENNQMQVTEEPVHLYSYLREQIAQFHSAAQSNQQHFSLQFHADLLLHVLLDKNKFEKILHNFCSNAIKFTPQEGSIAITLEETEHKQLLLVVADTGRGVHPEDLPYVFDRFYQSRQPDAPTEGGTGIGLSLVKELAELLKGAVWVESEPGTGSRFYFRFPCKEVPAPQSQMPVNEHTSDITAATEPALEETSSAAVPAKDTTILIVEDNADLLEYLRLLLSEYSVVTARNGREALDVLDAVHRNGNAVDLIISDLMMPVMDGFQLLEHLKADDQRRHLPVIMLTAKVNVQARLKALRIGVDDYLTKPFEEDELKARVGNLLNNYRKRLAYFSAAEPGKSAMENAARPVMAETDSEWLKAVESVFLKILSDRNFNLEWVATQLHLSSRQMSRRLQKLVGLSPHQYLLEMRLQTAREYLLHGRYTTVKETGFAVGYRDTEYFSTLFAERFGTTPSAYMGR